MLQWLMILPPGDLHWFFEISIRTEKKILLQITSLRISKFHFSSNLSFSFKKLRQYAANFLNKCISLEFVRSFASLFLSLPKCQVYSFKSARLFHLKLSAILTKYEPLTKNGSKFWYLSENSK